METVLLLRFNSYYIIDYDYCIGVVNYFTDFGIDNGTCIIYC